MDLFNSFFILYDWKMGNICKILIYLLLFEIKILILNLDSTGGLKLFPQSIANP